MRIKIVLLLAMLSVLCSCFPLKERNLTGQMPATVDANDRLALEFSNELAKRASLRITGRTKPVGKKSIDSRSSVSLRPNNGERLYITVIVDSQDKTLTLRIAGNIRSESTEPISSAAAELFQQWFSGSSLRPVVRYEGLLGP